MGNGEYRENGVLRQGHTSSKRKIYQIYFRGWRSGEEDRELCVVRHRALCAGGAGAVTLPVAGVGRGVGADVGIARGVGRVRGGAVDHEAVVDGGVAGFVVDRWREFVERGELG